MKIELISKKTGVVVKKGDMVRMSGGRANYEVLGWTAPRHINSSGRVYVMRANTEESFFPHVFGLTFTRCEACGEPAAVNVNGHCSRCAELAYKDHGGTRPRKAKMATAKKLVR